MKRNETTISQDNLNEYKRRVAFHEAGHAAGIHLNNKNRQLPPIFFNIVLKDINCVPDAGVYQATNDDYIARVSGGRLIELLPISIDNLAEYSDDFKIAYEADIVNLLIGPLAEARHIAYIDDEIFKRQLFNINALHYYGGSSDVYLVNEYLQIFSSDKQIQNEKTDELLSIAFEFVKNDANWQAINRLADFILESSEDIIFCEDVILLLDKSINSFEERRSRIRN